MQRCALPRPRRLLACMACQRMRWRGCRLVRGRKGRGKGPGVLIAGLDRWRRKWTSMGRMSLRVQSGRGVMRGTESIPMARRRRRTIGRRTEWRRGRSSVQGRVGPSGRSRVRGSTTLPPASLARTMGQGVRNKKRLGHVFGVRSRR